MSHGRGRNANASHQAGTKSRHPEEFPRKKPRRKQFEPRWNPKIIPASLSVSIHNELFLIHPNAE
jgi:hypothetical protein